MKANNDKLNRFFKQRLNDDTPAEDGWNMPSDDIFNKAKVHFPKEKKRKRPFFFWIGLGTLFIGLFSLSYFFVSNKTNTNNNTIVYSSKIENNSAVVETNVSKSKNEPIKEIVSENEVIQLVNSNNKIDNKSASSTVNNTVSVNKDEIYQPLTTRNEVNDFAINNNSIPSKIIETPVAEYTSNNTTVNSTISSENEVLTLAKRTLLDALPILDKENKIDAIPNEETVTKLGLLFCDTDALDNKRKIQKWEIGLTHAGFVIPFNHVVLKDSLKNQQISFDSKNINFNIPITRRFTRRWSLTSGYSYTNLSLDLKLQETIEFNQNATEDNIETLVDEIINQGVIQGSIELNDQKRNVEVKFMDNLALEDGDILTMNALIPLRLKLHQVPLLMNFHMGKRKWEWSVHTGVALEYFDISIPYVNLDVSENNTILTEEATFVAITEQTFEYAILAGGGVKYHINNHFNIGLNTKIDVLALPFARYELGLFYGFTPKNKNKTLMQF